MIYGVATNDLKHLKTQIVEYYKDLDGNSKRKVVWQCPFYTKWFAMLTRCYNKSELAKHPTYLDKTVSEDWLVFSNFKKWMEMQDWEGKQLDKDILFPGNTEYSSDTCVFISQEVNKFLLEKSASRDLPIGVTYSKTKRKFIATISCGKNGKTKHLGNFDDPKLAHIAWATEKLKMALVIAANHTDKRVSEAITLKYEMIYNTAINSMS